MWKKPNLPNPAPDSSSDSLSAESMGEMLMDIVRAANSAEPQTPPAPESECNRDQQPLLPMLQDYTESAERCLQTASEFLRQASLIPQALEGLRETYKNESRNPQSFR
jgi:hypothetical protein